MFAQHDCNIAHTRDIASHAADNVFFAIEVGLSPGIELGIVCDIVVAFRKELR